MRPYGRRPPIRTQVSNYQDCEICHPEDVVKNRDRRAKIEDYGEVTEFNFFSEYLKKDE